MRHGASQKRLYISWRNRATDDQRRTATNSFSGAASIRNSGRCSYSAQADILSKFLKIARLGFRRSIARWRGG